VISQRAKVESQGDQPR